MQKNFRRNLTEEETILWSELRVFRKRGYAFRRQVKLGPFTVDFLCRKAKLIVEVDGQNHGYSDNQWNHDQGRDAWLRDQGYKIIRIWNADIRRHLNQVMTEIEQAVLSRL